jgi:hypothetical protein
MYGKVQKTQEIYERFLKLVETWSEDPAYMVDWMMPSQNGNGSFSRWVGRMQRMACSPKDFRRQVENVHTLDAGDAPERISVRTKVMHVKGDRLLPVAGSRLLAKIIRGASYRELEGKDHFAWVMPSWREGTDAVIEFCTKAPMKRTFSRKFGAILFTDIVDSTRQSAALGDARWRSMLEGHDRVTRELIDRHGGRLVKSTGDGLLAVFDAPFEGVACGIQICDSLSGMGVTIRAGLRRPG